jgi:[protein-PII] uridylyltransferase
MPITTVTPVDVKALRQRLALSRQVLKEAYLKNPHPAKLLAQWRRTVDDVLKELWVQSGFNARMALAAVGGYGRGELYPYSDIDLLLLMPDTPDADTAQRIERLIGVLWDIGLEVGHSVRTLSECMTVAQQDLTIATTLTDVRHLSGSVGAIARLRIALVQHLNLPEFVLGKINEQRVRHLKHNDTAFNLEPNIKESPGGIRDLQSVLWLAWGAGLEPNWAALAGAGLITEKEVRQARRWQRFLQDLRIRLHYLAGRREDRLLFDLQGPLAQQLGFQDQGVHRASEDLMQAYYKTAKSVLLLNTILMEQLRARIHANEPVDHESYNDHFQRQGDLLGTIPEDLFDRDPDQILEGFLMLQRHPKLRGFTPAALRAVWRGKNRINTAFRAKPENQQRFMEILRQPLRTADVLRRMNYYGVLGRYIPAFGRIVGQMQHDLFHVYTVDEHILRVLRNIRRFAMPQYDHEFPFCSVLMREFDRVDLLYLGALFHDIAKGRGGDHSALGRADACAFCRRHGLSKADSEFVAWLVANHLHMSAVAQKQDLSDPNVIAEFAKRMGDERHLTALYLLTVADVRGTSPKVWNAWKGKLLEDLFRVTQRYLEGVGTDANTVIQEKRADALRILRHYGMTKEQDITLWKSLDASYFQRHDAQDIVWHARNLQGLTAASDPIVRARLSPLGEGIQVLIYTPDQEALFARICGYFDRIAYTIQEARIYTTLDGRALDSFQIVHRSAESEHYRNVLKRIEEELQLRLKTQAPLDAPQKVRLSRHLQHFPIPLMVHVGEPERDHLRPMTIVAGDRPGLLYRVSRVLVNNGINLRGARINTLGERAEDTFLLAGGAVETAAGREKLRENLLEELSA